MRDDREQTRLELSWLGDLVLAEGVLLEGVGQRRGIA